MNQETRAAVEKILDHPEISQILSVRKNDYGDRYLDDAIKKISYGVEIAESFGFDGTVTFAILAIKELAIPNFNAIGDEFLLEVDPQYSRALYGKRLAKKLLNQLNPDEIKPICDGVEHAINKTHCTPEEKIVQMIDTGFEFSVTLEPRSLASLFNSRYKYAINDKTAQAGVLTDHVIPPNTLPRRNAIVCTEEERQRRKALLYAKYTYYLNHPDEIPQAFRMGWDNLDERILVSYYVVGLKELHENH